MEKDPKPVNDRREGIIRDPVLYGGVVVSYVKDIGTQDPGYDANVRQVLIATPDGKTQVVPEADILREKKKAVTEEMEHDRVPDRTLPDNPANPTLERANVKGEGEGEGDGSDEAQAERRRRARGRNRDR